MKMKNLPYALIFVLVAFSINIQAQWNVYDGSYLPNEPFIGQPEFVKGDVTNGVTNGPEAVLATTVEDEEIPFNWILKMEEYEGNRRESWQTPMAPGNFLGITAVMRLKPTSEIVNIYNAGNTSVQYGFLSIRTNTGRVDMHVKPLQGIYLEAPAVSVPLSHNDWLIYRLTIQGDAVKLYLNENPVPVFDGVTDKTSSSEFIRFGPNSTNDMHGSMLDWLIWDESGAFAPGEGEEIPSYLSTSYVDFATSVNEVNNQLDFELTSFPNPSNGDVSISFVLREAGAAKVSVFNAVGMKVLEPLNASQLTAGSHVVSMNGTDLPQGVYYIVLEADGQSQTVKSLIFK